MNELTEPLQRANFSLTAGEIEEAGRRWIIRPVGELTSGEMYEELVIGPNHLRLKDIAEVNYEAPRREYGRHLDQKYAIGLDVFKESGAYTVEVSNLVMEEIDRISQRAEMQGINIFEMHNQATGIISTLMELFKARLIGAFFFILILYLFLRQISTTLIVALAVGMLVDNAVVVTENIHGSRTGLKRDTVDTGLCHLILLSTPRNTTSGGAWDAERPGRFFRRAANGDRVGPGVGSWKIGVYPDNVEE
ncbi:MAG: efflux RND transporter permease subunit [Balneolaceae bacterium]